MNDWTLPWIIGPVPLFSACAAASVILVSLITRAKLSAKSLASVWVLPPFLVAYAMRTITLSLGPFVKLLIAQVAAAVLCILLYAMLWRAQRETVVEVARANSDKGMSIKLIFVSAILLTIWDGFSVVGLAREPNAGCIASARYDKCHTAEILFGINGPFSNIYMGSLIGGLFFIFFILGIWRVLQQRRSAARKIAKND